MFQTGEKVIYGIHGVCAVTGREESRENGSAVSYLVLQPVGQDGSRYLVPEGNPVAMSRLHKVLTAKELEALLDSGDILSGSWIADENQRKQLYRTLIGSGDRISLMQRIHAIYKHKASQMAAGKKVHMCDDNFLRDAEKLLTGEISYVLEISPEEAKKYLRSKLNANP